MVPETIMRVATTPSSVPSESSVTGMTMTKTRDPVCAMWMGSRQAALDVQNLHAPGSVLKVLCPQASTLRLTNVNGQCLFVALPRARRIETAGNRTISMILPPTSLPTVVNVAGMTHWGPPGRSDLNTRVLIRLSQDRVDGGTMRPGSLIVEGKLRYAVPYGAYGVVVKGCGAASKVVCVVRDTVGRPVCRLVDKCEGSSTTAREVLRTQLLTMPPCTTPS